MRPDVESILARKLTAEEEQAFDIRNLIGVVVRLWGRAGGDGGRGAVLRRLCTIDPTFLEEGEHAALLLIVSPAPEPRLRGRPSGGARRSSALLPDDGRRRLRRGSGRRRERSAVASVVGGEVSVHRRRHVAARAR